ncbi:MAG: glycosyltransferase [Candidatus Omnitrophica bacterium]|nr:glycosyltransferase [Candidatus Omnitrophota bacterium]
MTESKKIDIIIPAYNKADLTVKAIDSVLQQTYNNIEIIVVDDGSTDETKKLISSVKDKSKVKYIYKDNGGACSARNLGIKVSQAQYIGFLDCDDMYLPQKVELSLAYLEDNPDIGFVHTAAYFIDENDTILRQFSPKISTKVGKIKDNLVLRNFICPSTTIIRKSCIDEVGYFDESIFTPADWDMWLRLTEKFKASYIDIPLTMYRVSDSYILSNLIQSEKEEQIVLDKLFVRNLQINDFTKSKAISNMYLRSAINYLMTGDLPSSRSKFLASLRENRLNFKALAMFIYFTLAKQNLRAKVTKKIFAKDYFSDA